MIRVPHRLMLMKAEPRLWLVAVRRCKTAILVRRDSLSFHIIVVAKIPESRLILSLHKVSVGILFRMHGGREDGRKRESSCYSSVMILEQGRIWNLSFPAHTRKVAGNLQSNY